MFNGRGRLCPFERHGMDLALMLKMTGPASVFSEKLRQVFVSFSQSGTHRADLRSQNIFLGMPVLKMHVTLDYASPSTTIPTHPQFITDRYMATAPTCLPQPTFRPTAARSP